MAVKDSPIVVRTTAELASINPAHGEIVETLGHQSVGVGAARYEYQRTGRSGASGLGYVNHAGGGDDDWFRLVHDGVIDVTQAGAIPGGTASANATAIQATLDAIADSCVMTFSPGVYAIDDRLYMDNASYVVNGYGATLDLESDGSGSESSTDLDYKNFWGNRNNSTPVGSFILKGLRIEDTANGSAEWKALIQLEKCGFTHIEDCTFVDTSTTCIQVGSRALTMVAGTQGDVVVTKCRSFNTDPASHISGNFFKPEHAPTVVFSHNIIKDFSRGFTLEMGNDDFIFDSVVCDSNVFIDSKMASKSATQTAIPVHVFCQFGTDIIRSLSIQGNVFRNTDMTGTASQGFEIMVSASANGQILSSNISGNTSYNLKLGGKDNSSYAVLLKDIDNARFSGNAFVGVAYEQFSFSANASTDVVTAAGHNLTNTTPVVLSSTTTLPSPLSQNTVYYVRDVSGDTFKLAATSGGPAIDITDTGTGTHVVNAIYRGIVIQSCTNIEASDNLLQGDFDIGLYINATTDSDIKGNLLRGTYSTGRDMFLVSATGTRIEHRGNGTPNGVYAAAVGSTFYRMDGSSGSVLYIKESGGTTSAGWSSSSDVVPVVSTAGDGDTTPTVSGIDVLIFDNSSPQDISNLSSGVNGQQVECHIDANTTLDDSGGKFKFDSSIGGTFNGGSDGKVITLRLLDGVWTQVGAVTVF